MNSKALAFFILALAAIGIGMYSYMNESGNVNSKILDLKHISLKNIKNIPTGLVTYFKKYKKEYVLADLVVNGSYSGVVSFDKVDTDVHLLTSSNSVLKVDRDVYRFKSPKSIVLRGFKGRIDVMENRVLVEGKVKGIELGGEIEINKEYEDGEEEQEVVFNSTYEYVYLKNATEENLVLPNFKGNIVMYVQGDTIDYKVSSKYIEFLRYIGEANVTSKHVLLKGEGVMKSDVLMTPVS